MAPPTKKQRVFSARSGGSVGDGSNSANRIDNKKDTTNAGDEAKNNKVVEKKALQAQKHQQQELLLSSSSSSSSEFDKVITIVINQGFFSSTTPPSETEKKSSSSSSSLSSWRDIIALSGVNRHCYETLCRDGDNHNGRIVVNEALKPLLEQLEGMVKTTGDSPLVLLDPRYRHMYNWKYMSTLDKCKEMVQFMTTITRNMRRQLHPLFNNPANYTGICFSWNLGRPAFDIYRSYQKRSRFARNLAQLKVAQNVIEKEGGNDDFFFDAVLGIGPIDRLGRVIGEPIREIVEELCPFDDQKFVDYVRKEIYPTEAVQELLGPVLMEKVILSVPFFRWIPPVASTTTTSGGGYDPGAGNSKGDLITDVEETSLTKKLDLEPVKKY